LARALVEAGHGASVLAPFDGGGVVPGIEPDGGVGFVALGRSLGLPANGSVAPVALSPGAARRAVRAVRGGGFDVLHLHEPLAPGPGPVCLVACALPKVGTFHRSGDSLAYRLLGPIARAGAARLALRCAVSEEAATTARRALGGTYRVVGNGVDLEHFATARPWPTQRPTVLFVGRHEERKGLSVLLDAVAMMVAAAPGTDAAPPVTVWVAGEGPQTEALRRRHPPSDSLQWLGRVDDDVLASRLAGAHVLCAPSLGGESFGIVLLEAMAARAAVVASDIPGYAAVLGGHGAVVPAGDAGALARALSQAASDAATGSGLCAPAALDAAFDHASQWAMSTVAERYVALYQEAVSLPAPP
jgi:phosphatidylinositol alpha-mannosyltransferase